ncbi:hypothetical protein SAMN05421813_1203 [Daejeonella rubra]|uniref:MetA-pathway of phenol degradation n=1 Tax=Daejeonella rubra TaxID=990371 RepID=A0A1G9VAR8_9SPHI|nr:hypothetical protein [Daejeonella rubra]SDM69328.1 hypothetical protein SAMN05421813_1203 [Daejeonella rubra]
MFYQIKQTYLHTHIAYSCKLILFIFLLSGSPLLISAQTENDAIMMGKNLFCTGIVYGNSNWNEYWEGTLKRENANLGTVSTNMIGPMGSLGVSSKLNVIFNLPYIKTQASAGQLKGFKGMQDLSIWLKWKPVKKQIGKGTMSLFGIGGYSIPSSDYVSDYLPLSIGLRSRNLSLRGMADYQVGVWTATVSGTYVHRSNIEIDRSSYYTTEMHYSNEVYMPDAAQVNLRMGYRGKYWVVEAVADNWTTLGGFDITRNNMPFPSNRMNMTRTGINMKYEPSYLKGLTLIGGANTTISGRNVGKSTNVQAGLFYIFNLSAKKSDKNQKK